MTGTLVMAMLVLVAFGVILRYAGGWGVPYFTFQTERGSSCTNTFTGYECSPFTLDDIEYFGDVSLTSDTVVLESSYVSTHDYELTALMEVPAASADNTARSLKRSFGECVEDHPSPLNSEALDELCVMANDNILISSGEEPSSRLHVVATGVRPDGTRVISLDVKSR